MSKTLIIAKIKTLHNCYCIEGIDLDSATALRFSSTVPQSNIGTEPPFQTGDLWDLRYTDRQTVGKNDLETVTVISQKKIGVMNSTLKMGNFLSHISFPVTTGSIFNTFQGKLKISQRGTLCMSRDEVSNPFCFWFSNREIKLSGYQQAYYTFFAEDCQTPLHLPYLGNEKNPMQLIAPNTLFCLSLSACSRQDDMCYVHIAQYY